MPGGESIAVGGERCQGGDHHRGRRLTWVKWDVAIIDDGGGASIAMAVLVAGEDAGGGGGLANYQI